MIDRKRVVAKFYQYVQEYDDHDGKIRLKKEHTLRVAMLCEEIGDSLGLTQEDKDLAWLIGMLHDMGRFDQLKHYGTFDDGKSVNHAALGVSLLFEQGLIRNYIEETEQDELVKTAILNHNVFVLPSHLEGRNKLFCDLIRDADKTDIFRVNVEISMEVIYGFTTQQLKQCVVTPEVMEHFFEHHAVLHKLKKAPIDYLVGHASLAFELVFPKSIQIVKEQGYLQRILEFESDNEVTRQQLMLIKKDMEKYIGEIGGIVN